MWPGRIHSKALHPAHHVGVTVLEERIELRAVPLEFGAFIEDLAKGFLHDGDFRTDTDLAAQLSAGCRAQHSDGRHGHAFR